jgi:hypothetical protein
VSVSNSIPTFSNDLRAILRAPGAGPLVCIPLDNPHSPKAPLWRTFRAAKYTSLYDDRGTYGSPFITRPDSSPWIDTPVYWSKVVDLWRGLDVVLVRGSEKSLRASDMPEAATCPKSSVRVSTPSPKPTPSTEC